MSYYRTKNQRELLAFIGSDYSMKKVDDELCVHRKFNKRFYVEITGTRKNFDEMTVWLFEKGNDIYGGERLVERVRGIKDLGEMKSVLDWCESLSMRRYPK